MDNRDFTKEIPISLENDSEIINWENRNFKELQCYTLNEYRLKRIDFLQTCIAKYEPESIQGKKYEFLINHINNRSYKIGYYAGSFNPFHIGHEDICKQAENVFDKVIIAQGINPDKKNPDTINVNNREVVKYNGLITELFNSEENCEKTLIRGLRGPKDVDDELEFLGFFNDLIDVQTTYFFSKPEYRHISSSFIRGLKKFGDDIINKYLNIKW